MSTSNSALSWVVLKVAQRCNLNCTYCYVYNRGDESWRSRPTFISTDVAVALAGRINEQCEKFALESFTVELHGGEPLLLGKERMLPIELSVGEQQRVGIARAVVAKPAVLIADEPTGNLDPALALEVMKLFRRFQDVGVTVIVATHDLHVVHEFGQRTIVLDDGQIQGSADVPLPSMTATR